MDAPVDGAALTASFAATLGQEPPAPIRFEARTAPERARLRRNLIRLLQEQPHRAPEIAARFERSTDPAERETIAMALAAAPPGPTVDRLRSLAAAGDTAAMIALAGRTDSRSLDALLAHMEVADPARTRAAEVLMTVVDEMPAGAREALIARVRALVAADPDAASIMLMADLGAPDVPALEAAAASTDPAVSAAARRALAEATGDIRWMEAFR